MSWMSSANNNEEMVKNLRRYEQFHHDAVGRAMIAVDRAHFVPSHHDPYMDSPQYIGHGVTISAPHMHAMCLDYLVDYLQKPGARALDVGSGSGIMLAYFAHIMKTYEDEQHQEGSSEVASGSSSATGRIFGIEYIEPLTVKSVENLQRSDTTAKYLQSGFIQVSHGDGWQGLPQHAPFQVIHVGAAAETMPRALVDQLASPGRMIIPVGPQHGPQYLTMVDKDAEGNVHETRICGVQYVPLVNNNNSNNTRMN